MLISWKPISLYALLKAQHPSSAPYLNQKIYIKKPAQVYICKQKIQSKLTDENSQEASTETARGPGHLALDFAILDIGPLIIKFFALSQRNLDLH